MAPEDIANSGTGSDQKARTSPAVRRGRRSGRGRRGGRRGPPAKPLPEPDAFTPSPAVDAPTETVAAVEQIAPLPEPQPLEALPPTSIPEQEQLSPSAAQLPEAPRRAMPEKETPAPLVHEFRSPRSGAMQKAIDEVNQIISTLRDTIDEMEEVLETLELAERQKEADEREIDSLRRALRQLQRPRESGAFSHRSHGG